MKILLPATPGKRLEGSPEWLAIRSSRRMIGGSQIAGCLGFDPREGRSSLDTYMDIMGLNPPLVQTPAMEAGSHFERAIAELWCKRNGAELLPSPGLIQHPRLPFVCGTPDFGARLADNGKVALEIKRRSFFARGDWMPAPPLPEYTQGMFYTDLAEVDRVVFIVDFGEGDLYDHVAVKNEIFLMEHEEALAEWYERHIVAGVPPAPRGDDLGAYLSLRGEPTGEVIHFDDGELAMVEELERLRAEGAIAEKREKQIKAWIATRLGNAVAGVFSNGLMVTMKRQVKQVKAKEAHEQVSNPILISRKGM